MRASYSWPAGLELVAGCFSCSYDTGRLHLVAHQYSLSCISRFTFISGFPVQDRGCMAEVDEQSSLKTCGHKSGRGAADAGFVPAFHLVDEHCGL